MRSRSAEHAPIPDMDATLGFNLRMAQLHFFDAFYRDFGHAGISPAEYTILTVLAHCHELRQGELAARLNIKRSNMTKVMRSLEGRGLISRSTPNEDGRAFDVRLTRAGKKLQSEMARAIPGHDRQAAASLTPNERETLLNLLRKLLHGHRDESTTTVRIKEEELTQ